MCLITTFKCYNAIMTNMYEIKKENIIFQTPGKALTKIHEHGHARKKIQPIGVAHRGILARFSGLRFIYPGKVFGNLARGC